MNRKVSPVQQPNTHTAEFIPKDAEGFVFLDNQVLDSLVSTVLELSAEVWSLKRRVLVTEGLLDAAGTVPKAAIETYRPTEQEDAEWRAQRDRFIKRIYAPFARKVPLKREPGPETFIQR